MEILVGKQYEGVPVGFVNKMVGTIISVHENTVIMTVDDYHEQDRTNVIDKQHRVVCGKSCLNEVPLANIA